MSAPVFIYEKQNGLLVEVAVKVRKTKSDIKRSARCLYGCT